MDPASATTIISGAFDGFGGDLLAIAPALVGVGLVVYAVPRVFRWATSLIG